MGGRCTASMWFLSYSLAMRVCVCASARPLCPLFAPHPPADDPPPCPSLPAAPAGLPAANVTSAALPLPPDVGVDRATAAEEAAEEAEAAAGESDPAAAAGQALGSRAWHYRRRVALMRAAQAHLGDRDSAMPLEHHLDGGTATEAAAHLEARARGRLPDGESRRQHTLDHVLPLALAELDPQMPTAMSMHNLAPMTR